MYIEKKVKAKCLLSILISTNIWIFIPFQSLKSTYTSELFVIFLFFVIIQFFSILLASNVFRLSNKQITRKGSTTCLVYSILSLILFLYVNKSFIL